MRRQQSGFATFTVVWLGQLLSVVGTRMTNFAISIWVWDATGSATQFASVLLASFAATVIFSPIVGVFIDRWNRRLTMMMSDLGSAAATGVLLIFFMTGSVQMWQLYLVNFATGAFLAFQVPVFSSTITLLMERGQYPRANAMMFVARSGPGLFAPAAAAALLASTNIQAILLVDTVSYGVAIAAVLAVGIPQTPQQPGTPPAKMWQDCLFGFKYILRSPSFRNLQAMLIVINILASLGFVLLRPLVLTRTGNSVGALSVVMTTGAFGGVLGAVLLGATKAPRDKMLRVLGAILIFSILGRLMYGLADIVALLAISLMFVSFTIPIIDGYTNSIWQEKVEPRFQGRVFAARQFTEELTVPIATLIAGPLVDNVLTPWMQPDAAGAHLFGSLFGTGQAGGIGLIFAVIGVLGVGVAIAGFRMPSVRRIETLLPDHESLKSVEGATA
ncbi:MFS transporter [Nocardia sp. NPDC050175]|uniref:MFS transporter n=1 Tax=Nocardia sp. NPDC050175 TaxID=3364317 RepID=UPI0037BDC6A1